MVEVGRVLWKSLRISYQHLLEIVILSLIWFITSLPLLTLGATTAGVIYSLKNLESERRILRSFFRGFRIHFKKTLPWGLLLTFLILVITSSLWYHLTVKSIHSLLFLIFQVLISLIISFTQIYAIPLIVRFEGERASYMKLSTYLALNNIVYTIGVTMEIIFLSIILLFTVVGFILLSAFLFMFLYLALEELIPESLEKGEIKP